MRNKLLIGISLATTVAYWVVLVFHLPLFKSIPNYFWHFMQFIDKPLGNLWLIIPVVGLAIPVVLIVMQKPQRHKLNLLLLILLGYIIQMSFGFMEGRGLDGIRSRMVMTGHAEFAEVAAVESDLLKVATRYEELCRDNKSLRYANTKPPGQLLFYILTQKLSNLVAPESTPVSRFIRLVTFASYVYPLLTYLAIIPLLYFCRLFMEDRLAILPCILYLFVPSVTLVTLHLDQVLYPTLFMLGLYLIAYASHKNSLVFAMLSGALFFLALYVSFSLLPLALLVLILTSIYYCCLQQRNNKLAGYLKVLAGFVVGVLILLITFKMLLNYDPLVRFQNAMSFHRTWKAWEPGIKNTVLFAFLNYVEYACWIGLPIVALYLANAGNAVKATVKRQFSVMSLQLLSTVVIFVLLGFLGTTKGEVGRLWIFMVPPVCIFVCYELAHWFEDRVEWAFGLLLTMQLITTLAIKRYQDFW